LYLFKIAIYFHCDYRLLMKERPAIST